MQQGGPPRRGGRDHVAITAAGAKAQMNQPDRAFRFDSLGTVEQCVNGIGVSDPMQFVLLRSARRSRSWDVRNAIGEFMAPHRSGFRINRKDGCQCFWSFRPKTLVAGIEDQWMLADWSSRGSLRSLTFPADTTNWSAHECPR